MKSKASESAHMKIEVYFESKHGNGKKVVEKLAEDLTAKGHAVGLHHIGEVRPKEMPSADLYLFSSPTRMGKPVGSMRRFVKKVKVPTQGAKYALIATHGAAKPNKKTGVIPSPAELEKWRRTIPMMEEILNRKGMMKVADLQVYVLDLKGPLEDGWEDKVGVFAELVLSKL